METPPRNREQKPAADRATPRAPAANAEQPTGDDLTVLRPLRTADGKIHTPGDTLKSSDLSDPAYTNFMVKRGVLARR